MEPKEIGELRDKWQAEIADLTKEKAKIENKIVGLQTMIKGLDYMEHGAPAVPAKLEPPPLPCEDFHLLRVTDAIRAVIGEATHPVTPVQVRDRLLAYGYDKLPPGNPMAAIHGVLRRLLNSREIVPMVLGGKKVYRRLIQSERDMIPPGQIGAMTGSAIVFGRNKPKR